ncbi:MAG: hypothetical protein OXB95_12970 [Rhodobacteraceae bacterium]|nr:hypothetical protein [Paracoccaceae bacterium]
MNNSDSVFQMVPPSVVNAVAKICDSKGALTRLEGLVVSHQLEALPLFQTVGWARFRDNVRHDYESHDFVAIRGFSAEQGGAALLVALRTIGESLRTFRGGKVVKHFKMSPWTRELSHTLRAGEFHTDHSTQICPPAVTGIQCLEPDPGTPKSGLLWIARLSDLLEHFETADCKGAGRFLMDEETTMLSDRSSSSWTGNLVSNGTIRYHPETIRAAARRSGNSCKDIDKHISAIENAALERAIPLALNRGDLALISNHRALHRRGKSSVVFKNYPTEFESRRVAVAHATKERRHT